MTCKLYWIFCITDHASIFKIGIANNLKTRLNQLKTGIPYKVSRIAYLEFKNRNDAKTIEKSLHTVLKDFNGNGEWFIVTKKNEKRNHELQSAVLKLVDEKLLVDNEWEYKYITE